MGAIEQRYRDRTPTSAALYEDAQRVMAGGETRAAGFHLPYPITVVRGDGARVWDADGNEYIDAVNNFTSLIHGHAFPPVVEAATKQIAQGTAWPARAPQQAALAELLVNRVPSVDLVRFGNSGTEASMLAMHVAKVVTGRPKILMARYGYHGAHEATESGTYAGAFTHPLYGGADGQEGSTLLADFGDADGFERVLAEHGDDIAAVMLEAVQGSAGLVAAPPGFLSRVADATRAAGAVFVVDEVITFRLAVGGAQTLDGVEPDLTMFGKIIGGGFPVGALGGRRELMEILDPRARKMLHSGTFNGNPVTTAAGCAAMQHYGASEVAHVDALGARLHVGLEKAAADVGLPISVRRSGSLLNAFLSESLPASALLRDDKERMAAFFLAAHNHGLYVGSRGLFAVSTPMDENTIDVVIERVHAALADVAAELA